MCIRDSRRRVADGIALSSGGIAPLGGSAADRNPAHVLGARGGPKGGSSGREGGRLTVAPAWADPR
eukprot:9583843-Alexandrium_andersonii.AAC.1